MDLKLTRISLIFDGLLGLFCLAYLGGWVAGSLFFKVIAVILFLYFLFPPKFMNQSRFFQFTKKATSFFQSTQGRWSLLLLFFVISAMINILQSLSLEYYQWDVGIYHQVIWSLSEGHGFHSTISRAGDFFWDHLSPTLVILVPFFWLLDSSALILPFFDAVFTYVGVAAWVYLATHFPGVSPKRRAFLALATIVFAFFFKSFWGNLRWGFHVNVIAFASMSWALSLLILSDGKWNWKRSGIVKRLGVLFLFLLGAFSKEMLLLNVAIALSVWSWIEVSILRKLKKRNMRGILFSVSLILVSLSLVGIFLWYQEAPRPQIKNYYLKYYSYLGSTTTEFITTLFLKPRIVFEVIGVKALASYYLMVLSPWLFLPLIQFFRRNMKWGYFSPLWLLMCLPSLASATLSEFWALRHPSYQYVYELWCVLGVLTVGCLAVLKSRVWIAVWVLVTVLQSQVDPRNAFMQYWNLSNERSKLRQTIASIPPHLTVQSSAFIGAWAASRLWIETYPNRDFIQSPCPDYLIENPRDVKKASQSECLKNHSYEQLSEFPGWKIYRKENL